MSAPVNILCNGGPGGSATVAAGGGAYGYTYNWTPNGGAGATGIRTLMRNLPCHCYGCTNGCIATATVIITQQTTLLTATISASINILCEELRQALTARNSRQAALLHTLMHGHRSPAEIQPMRQGLAQTLILLLLQMLMEVHGDLICYSY